MKKLIALVTLVASFVGFSETAAPTFREAFTAHAWVGLPQNGSAAGDYGYGILFKGSRRAEPPRVECALVFRYGCPEFKYMDATGEWQGIFVSGRADLRGRGAVRKIGELPLLTKDDWYHIVGVYDRGRVALYGNGRLVMETKGNPPVPVNADKILIGAQETAVGRVGVQFPGLITGAGIDDGAWTAEQVAAAYAAEKGNLPERPKAVAYPTTSFDDPVPFVQAYSERLKAQPPAVRASNCVARLVRVGGQPRLTIDGKLVSAQAMMPSPYESDAEVTKSCRDFAAAGVKLFSNIWWARGKKNDWWLGDGVYDWKKVDARFKAMIDGAPEGWVFPRLKMDPPDWWVKTHPKEMYKGQIHPASAAWRDLRRRMVEDFVRHVESSDYAAHVVGYHVGAMSGTEWLNWPADKEIGQFGKPIADALLDAARQVKELTRGTKLVGSFHGYNGPCHSDFLRVLESPDIDFICAPANYGRRRGGDAGSSQVYNRTSCALHGKLFYEEADIRTHYAQTAVEYRCTTKEESLNVIKRAIGQALAYGQDLWWFLLAGNDTFHDEAFLTAIGIGSRELARAAASTATRETELVAFHQPAVQTRKFFEVTLPFCGAPVDAYLPEDRAKLASVPRLALSGADERLPADELAALMKASGVHRYLNSGDLVNAGCGYLVVHATSEGEKTITLPETCDLVEIFGASPIRRGVKTFTEYLRFGETRVWRMENRPGERAAVAMKAADACVVYAPKGCETKGGRDALRDAAQDLALALGKVGAREVVCCEEGREPKDKPCIYLGNSRAAAQAGLDAQYLPHLAYRIVGRPNRLYVLSPTGSGVAYGVTELCERYLGYRFLTFSGADPFTVDATRTFPVCDYTDRPAIYYRQLYTGDSIGLRARWKDRYASQKLRRRFYAKPIEFDSSERISEQTGHCHSQFSYLKPEKYFKDHPEYYSMGTDGKRHGVRNKGSNLCMTNPHVLDIVTSNMLAKIAKDRASGLPNTPHICDFTQMDSSPALCRCPECRKVAERYCRVPGKYETGGDAGLQLEFVNELARRVRAKYPETLIRIFAYVSTEVPPKGGIVPEDNVIIWLCDLYTNSDHELPLDAPVNAARRQLFVDWMKIAKRFEIWDYMLYGDGRDSGGPAGDFPEVNVDAIAADAKLFHRLGIGRLFMESEFHDQPFYELNVYVMSECWWNPYVDLEKLIDNYCTVYGRAAGQMRKTIDCLRGLIRDNPLEKPAGWWGRKLPWLTVPNLEKVRAMLDEAYALEDDPEMRARVAWPLASVNRKLAALYGLKNDLPARKDAYARAYRAAVEAHQVDFRGPYAAEWPAAEMTLASKFSELRFRDMPADVASATDDDLLCVDVTRLIRTPPSLYRDDPLSERGKCMRVMKRVGAEIVLPDVPVETAGGSFTPEKGGGYRWYRLGRFEITKGPAFFWITPARCAYFDLREFFRNADGVGIENPNVYDAWLSVRFDDALYVDRLVLRRRHGEIVK